MRESNTTLTRRELLARSAALGAFLVVGSSIVAAPNAAWAMEVKHLKPETMATLIQMARDIYPHDNVSDAFYAKAVKAYDSQDKAKMIEAGIADLNKKAGGSYLKMGWEKDRVKLLQGIENTDFFQTVRGGLVTGLYNQKEVWPIFGYEGESFSKGGYINHGFNDINWL